MKLRMSRNVVAALLIGCAAPPAGRTFEATPEQLRAACVEALNGWPIEAEGDVIETGWRETDSTAPSAGQLLGTRGLERSRFHVTIGDNTVGVRADVERRPRLGATATRWERVFSDGSRERAFLDRVAEALP